MEQTNHVPVRRPNPRRKKRHPVKRFLRSYGPLLGIAVLIVLFIVFAAGSVQRANEKREQARQESLAVEASLEQQQLDWEKEAQEKIAEAEIYAASCDFDKAIACLDSFSGNLNDFDELLNHREKYEAGESTLVAWEDITKIPFLSFGQIVMDADKAFTGENSDGVRYYGISTEEFTGILEQLYANGYMLVDLYDLFSTKDNGDGTFTVEKKELKLPAGRKPIVFIHSQSEGYSHRLTLTDNGGFTTTVEEENSGSFTGSYDFVPLLEEFLAKNPGFSFRGARAVLAVTGYKGLFGNPIENTADITALAAALRETGYTLAGNTYGNVSYGRLKDDEFAADLASWQATVTPLLGETEILAFAKSSDIEDTKEPYSGDKYKTLHAAGFRYYLGICYNSNPWMSVSKESIRIGRIMVTGNYLETNEDMYEGLFSVSQILDPNR